MINLKKIKTNFQTATACEQFVSIKTYNLTSIIFHIASFFNILHRSKARFSLFLPTAEKWIKFSSAVFFFVFSLFFSRKIAHFSKLLLKKSKN